eukprot:NODE_897_length_661_cov_74.980392_g827_i0.p4 GENE.NODE_897_length_661_cov_74.980392_g827_i0~~NODE_897_length_661_cov_74.980392_g827_i0.p4  ORF type:complete len:50 (-),score=5.99 NODE_897_length_661_cov_74.980392_g827_i0:127-276(-)
MGKARWQRAGLSRNYRSFRAMDGFWMARIPSCWDKEGVVRVRSVFSASS